MAGTGRLEKMGYYQGTVDPDLTWQPRLDLPLPTVQGRGDTVCRCVNKGGPKTPSRCTRPPPSRQDDETLPDGGVPPDRSTHRDEDLSLAGKRPTYPTDRTLEPWWSSHQVRREVSTESHGSPRSPPGVRFELEFGFGFERCEPDPTVQRYDRRPVSRQGHPLLLTSDRSDPVEGSSVVPNDTLHPRYDPRTGPLQPSVPPFVTLIPIKDLY